MTHRNFIFSLFAVFSGLAFSHPAHALDLYRFYSDDLKAHFYTASLAERDALDLNSQWRYEGIAYDVSSSDAMIPVYRFWSPQYKNHFYTTNTNERDDLIANDPNWNFEGQAFTVTSTGLPVYRFYSPVFKGHFFTTSGEEKKNLEQNDPNWNYEGIAWFAKPVVSAALPSQNDLDAGIEQKAKEFEVIDPDMYPGNQRVVYQVDSVTGKLLGDAQNADRELWNIIRELAPNESVRKSVTEFEVYYDTGNNFSASVSSVGGQLKQWRFSVNYTALQTFSQMPSLIVHEYAHLLSYQPLQISTILNDRNVEQNCTTYFDDGFCFLAGSYIDTHFQEFWKNTNALTDGNRSASEALEHYRAYTDDFVSTYATTNVEEDFSETLTAYIFDNSSSFEGKSAQKISALGGYAALDDYRKKAREVVQGWAN